MKHRIAEALLLALFLLTVQTAILAHAHEGSAAPAGAAAQSCEFCVGYAAGAPPAQADAQGPGFHQALAPDCAGPVVLAARFHPAHRSRAPPVFDPG